MTEDQELQARIAALSGRINLHKQGTSHESGSPGPVPSSPGAAFPSSSAAQRAGYGRGNSNWTPYRGASHGHHRGRGARPSSHRNRSLVLKANHSRQNPIAIDKSLSAPQHHSSTSAVSSTASTPTFVSKRDRHMQLINTAVFDRLSKERSEDMVKTAEHKQNIRNMREKAKLNRHFQRLAHSSNTSNTAIQEQQHFLDVENIRFRVVDGGSKLVRVSDDPNMARTTPKRARIGGVTFFRSKNGNLYRAGLVGAKKSIAVKKSSEPCPKFTNTGLCSDGPNCRYVHDPSKVAICKDFLQKGTCPAGDACDLSHDPIAERVPACVHFLRGNCTNDHCRYAHIRVNPAAPVCYAFATFGYCEKGSTCTAKHVFECPDYANKGMCRKTKCRLPHVDRAGQIRKAAAIEASANEDESPDLTSDEEDYDEIDSEDVDSDGIDDTIVQSGESNMDHELSQQQDFVHF